MKEYIFPLLALLLIGAGFGLINEHMNITNGTNNHFENNHTVLMNRTGSEFIKIITTPKEVITLQKTNGSIQITVNNTRLGNVLQVLKNRTKRAYVFHLLKNKELNSTVKEEIRKKIITAMRNSTLRKEILQNKTILAEIVHPKVKPIVETGMIKNTTIIKNGNSTLISMKVVVHKKIFGFWPVNMDEDILTNDTYYKIKRPWWSILAI